MCSHVKSVVLLKARQLACKEVVIIKILGRLDGGIQTLLDDPIRNKVSPSFTNWPEMLKVPGPPKEKEVTPLVSGGVNCSGLASTIKFASTQTALPISRPFPSCNWFCTCFSSVSPAGLLCSVQRQQGINDSDTNFPGVSAAGGKRLVRAGAYLVWRGESFRSNRWT